MSPVSKLFKVKDEYIYFDSASSSQEYAKNNPGAVIVRNLDAIEDDWTIVSQEPKKEPRLDKSPQMILEYLNEHIISQDEAKRDIALAMYYHSLKAKYPTNCEIGTNGPVMIVGPTGSGKTFIVQKACEYIDTVFLHVDTASMVPVGIKGYSTTNIISDIFSKANYDIKKASHCVVFLDEIDKLFHTDDASKYGPKVATQLLRIIEGSKFSLPEDVTKIVGDNGIEEFDTSNIQFVLGGAFQWLLDEKKDKKSMGFNSQDNLRNTAEITLEDLYREDIPKELLGRMSSIINLKSLSQEDYFDILTKSLSSPLKEFVKKIEFHGDKVDINDETLHYVSKKAAQSELGVRSMKQTLKSIFNDALFATSSADYQTHIIRCEGNLPSVNLK
ncbi:AAA family ATPase [Sulfurimonas sp. SAG-AH-194-C21]|nr:AAA family ATPase [Sulfurimonas sp. SAG-AH-194-C21]MDF1884126.1 AAA family ATPase [Sulfurimonas sp. SAG-AH-194-C21]